MNGDRVKTADSRVLNSVQRRALIKAVKKASCDPSYLSSIAGGGPVEEFEEAFAKATGGKYALALSSCTAALHTAFMALGIGPGDELIVSPYTWGQSVAPVLFTGATAVFADIDPNTLTSDPASVEDRISSRTRAIIPVHIFGNPADMDSLCAIAEKHGIAVISDAAQAFGALSKGRRIGSLGDAACFSLGPGKAVFGGEGGVLVTNDGYLYERAVSISQHPLRAFSEVTSIPDFACMDELSWNYRIHPLAAVMTLADLEVAPQRVADRRQALDSAHKAIEHIPGLEPVYCCPGDLSAAYRIPLTFNSQKAGSISREEFIHSLQERGILVEAGPIRVPIHLRQMFQNGDSGPYRVASHFSHLRGSCPAVEMRCEKTELVVSRHRCEKH
jgi:perosamine synthetase